MTKLPTEPTSFKGAADGLKITVFWGDILYDTAVCKPNKSITVGTGPGNTFVLDTQRATSAGSMELVKVLPGHSAELYFDEELDGHIRLGGKLLSLKSAIKSSHAQIDPKLGRYSIKMSKGDKADVVIGHMSFYFDWMEQLERIPGDIFSDRKKLGWLLLSFLGLVLTVGLLAYLPSEEEKPPERLVMIMPRKLAPAKAAMGSQATKDGGAQKGELGKANLTPQAPPSKASELRQSNLGSLVSGLTSLGSNAPAVNRDAPANSASAQAGSGGFSSEGLKTGGGGKSVGIGRQVGEGEGGFSGTGRLGLSGNSAVEGSSGYGSEETEVRGGLPRDVIDAIIRRRIDRIRLCYERQLNFHPTLKGKVTVHFVIGKAGNVLASEIKEDKLRNPEVKECILSEVQSWTFPAPEGGTLVNVDYPFFFESTAK